MRADALSMAGARWENRSVSRTGKRTKSLVSAGAVHRTGRCTWLEKRGGWIVKEDGDLAYQIKQLIRKYIDDGGRDVIPLYEERGVYTGYVDRGGGHAGAEPSPGFGPGGNAELCPFGEGVPHRQAWP